MTSDGVPPTGPSTGGLTADGSDPDALARVLVRVGPVEDPDHPRPLLTLEEFFTGNGDAGSIGYNLAELSGPQEMFQALREVRARREVLDVRVQVQDLEGEWPASDSVWVVVTAGTEADVVASWFPEALAPDEVELYGDLADVDPPVEPYPLPAGAVAVLAFYD